MIQYSRLAKAFSKAPLFLLWLPPRYVAPLLPPHSSPHQPDAQLFHGGIIFVGDKGRVLVKFARDHILIMGEKDGQFLSPFRKLLYID